MKKLLNFRAFVVIILFMMTSICICYVSYYNKFAGAILFILLFGVIGILVCLNLSNRTVIISLLLAAALSVAVAVLFFATLDNWTNDYGDTSIIYGRVTEDVEISSDEIVFIMDELTIDSEDANGNMKVSVEYTSEYACIECGFVLCFEAAVYTYDIIDDGINASYVRHDLRYHAYPEYMSAVGYNSPSLLESIRLDVRDTIMDNMSYDEAAITYGMIMGDRSYISDDLSSAFSNGGIGHILTVSGLHIGVLMFVLMWLLSLLPLPKSYRPFICMGVLVFYAVLTGGSPSVVRAVIMCCITLLSKYFGKPDLLNSLCLAGCICLLISPFFFFEVGFIMSFSAVLGIALLSPPLRRLLSRTPLPTALSETLALTLSVQIGIFPSMLYFFHSFYVYSTIINCIMLPLLSLIYVAVFISMLISIILPFMSFLLTISSYAVWLLIVVCTFVSSLPLASVIMHNSVGIFLITPLMLFPSDYFMAGVRAKVTCYIMSLVLLLGIPVLTNNASTYTNSLLVLTTGETIIFDDDTYLVGDISEYATTMLLSAHISDGLTVVPTSMTDEVASNIAKLSLTYDIDLVVIAEDIYASGVSYIADAGLDFVFTSSYESFTAIYSDSYHQGWAYANDDVNVVISNSSSYTTADYSADLIIRYTTYSPLDSANYIVRWQSYDYSYDYSNVYVTASNGNTLYDFKSKTLCFV